MSRIVRTNNADETLEVLSTWLDDPRFRIVDVEKAGAGGAWIRVRADGTDERDDGGQGDDGVPG